MAGGVLYFSSRSAWKEPCGCGPVPPEATGEFEWSYSTPIFENQPVDFDLAQLAPSEKELVLRESILGVGLEERWIEIDLSEQKLRAWEGNRLVYEFLVSTGKWAPTPTGDFRIWIKLRSTKMSGGRPGTGTYYYLPNVPYTQYFYNGYGLHGTYWHNNFGHPMSHGCVNLATPDAEKLFYWTSPPLGENRWTAYPSKNNPGTRVVVHD